MSFRVRHWKRSSQAICVWLLRYDGKKYTKATIGSLWVIPNTVTTETKGPRSGTKPQYRSARRASGRSRSSTSVRVQPGTAVGSSRCPFGCRDWCCEGTGQDREAYSSCRLMAGHDTVAGRRKIGEVKVSWTEKGACNPRNGINVNALFFSDGQGERYEEAKAICAVCPVTIDCRDYAIETKQDDGMWGGLTPYERRQFVRSRRKKARRDREAS